MTALLNAAPQTAHVVTLPGVNRRHSNDASASDDSSDGSVSRANGDISRETPGLGAAGAAVQQATAANTSGDGRAAAAGAGAQADGHADGGKEESFPSFRHVDELLTNPEAGETPDAVPILNGVAQASDDDLDQAAHHFETVPVGDVGIGDVLVVLPGETVPVDGTLINGTATLDLSNINGEPVPRTVYAGAEVLSGSVNGSTAMLIRATRLAKDSQYQNILELVKSAQDSRSAAVKTADMLAVPFTIVSFIIAFVAWGVSGSGMRFAQVLVLATPCPLLIAAPVAYVAGTGRLAKHSILVKTQDVLENLGRVTHIFFDKTGTLTVKQPQVVRIERVRSARGAAEFTEDQLLVMAGIVESYSVHILAKGIAQAGKAAMVRMGKLTAPTAGVDPAASKRVPQHEDYPVVKNIAEEAGRGVYGVVDGHEVRVGRLAFVTETGPVAVRKQSDKSAAGEAAKDAADRAAAQKAAEAAQWPTTLEPDEMATYVSVDGHLAARIVLRDIPRENAVASIAELKRMGVTKLTMLTGDKRASAELIGREVGIGDVRYELLPEDKVNAVRSAEAHDRDRQPWWDKVCEKFLGESMTRPITMMVGDGVNDAPVLAVADIGVAMTDGTSTAASESAQVVIMDDDIGAVPLGISIARHTKKIMLQAVLLGIGLAIIGMLCAAFNLIPVVVGAFLQECIDVVSILWALTAMFDRN
ncbi:heavy metal translocating P-type ATPase [Bifidobacterium sp. BRDM6]|uniref:Heavy metal translocating P-type ATPase n=1 Tax=Bifidobacterium choloepi TaxID=2614131 RepID=A0A6I5N1A6_9BIFI|nr:heavy metal translocating P-type ATPase [Bifidobacterium choloepi]